METLLSQEKATEKSKFLDRKIGITPFPTDEGESFLNAGSPELNS